jgi:hypothetical protein
MRDANKIICKKAMILSSNDNDNYDNFRDKVLIITHAAREGRGYDNSIYPELLCDFECEDGSQFPFALYEYEFELL